MGGARARLPARVLVVLALCAGLATMSRGGVAWSFDLGNPNTWPLIPIPEIVTDPYAGTTLGVMPVFLRTDANQQIRTIVAPDINYNTILGPGGALRYFSYPSADTQWYAIGGAAQNNASSVEFDYATGMERRRWWTLEGHFLYQRNPTERFFGLGNDSSFGNQTNYALEQVYADVIFGVNVTPRFQIALRERPRLVRIQHGALSNLPYIGTLFPQLKGLDGGSELLNQLIATYDTRDSLEVPTRGGMAALFAGVADRSLLSSASYTSLAGDFRHYLKLSPRVTLAGQLYARYVLGGSETPFWAMSWMGGDGPGESSLLGLPISDEQSWRGGGSGRFIDNNLFLLNFEVRTRVYERALFNTHGIFELAPFVDLGRVFKYAASDPLSNLHPAGGLGFRAIALPFVVAFVDAGYGPNGMTLFSGINYPF